jgi:hypothetical protein
VNLRRVIVHKLVYNVRYVRLEAEQLKKAAHCKIDMYINFGYFYRTSLKKVGGRD